MPKKNFVLNAAYQMLLNLVLNTLKFLLNWVGKKEKFRFTNVLLAAISGITLISSVCLLAQ